MATLQNVLKTFVPQAIYSANICYQEHLRGTSNQDLYVPVAARIATHVAKAFIFCTHPEVINDSKFTLVTLIALPILTTIGLRYYGASQGYNINFGEEMVILFASPIASKFVESLTTPTEMVNKHGKMVKQLDYNSKTDNQKRVAILMHILIGIGTSCALYKFQADRNSSLPLKPYLYFAAGVTILQRLQWYNRLDQKLDDATSKSLSSNIAYYTEVYQVASGILIGFGMAQAVKLATGQPIQLAWHWEALSSAASVASRTYFTKIV